MEAVTDVLDVDGASAWLADDPTGRVIRVASTSGDIELPEGLTWNLTGPLADRLVGDQQGVAVDDLAESDLVPGHVRPYLQAGSGIASPLVVAGDVVGVLTAGSRQARHFTEGDSAVLQRLANQAAVALENARLHANLKALSADKLSGEVVNVALGRRTTLNQLYGMLQDVIGTDIPAEYGPTRAGDVKHSEADISRAVGLLGYETLVTVEEGIRRTVDWYRDFRKS